MLKWLQKNSLSKNESRKTSTRVQSAMQLKGDRNV